MSHFTTDIRAWLTAPRGCSVGESRNKRARFRSLFGPHLVSKDKTTFPYVSAFNVLAATRGTEQAAPPELFRNKVVLIGGTAPGLYDAKSTPLDELYPGLEWQATAIENILFRQRDRISCVRL